MIEILSGQKQGTGVMKPDQLKNGAKIKIAEK